MGVDFEVSKDYVIPSIFNVPYSTVRAMSSQFFLLPWLCSAIMDPDPLKGEAQLNILFFKFP